MCQTLPWVGAYDFMSQKLTLYTDFPHHGFNNTSYVLLVTCGTKPLQVTCQCTQSNYVATAEYARANAIHATCMTEVKGVYADKQMDDISLEFTSQKILFYQTFRQPCSYHLQWQNT